MTAELSELLDSRERIDAVDRSQMLPLISRFDRDLQESLRLVEKFQLAKMPQVSNAVLLGMGGSAIGGDLLKAFCRHELSVPFEVVRGYAIPAYVGERTLVVVSSYSGDTEETLSAFRAAVETGARIVCLTSGGEVENVARQKGLPLLKLPGGRPPRTALPFSLGGLLGVFEKTGLVLNACRETEDSIAHVKERLESYGPSNPAAENPAKSLAMALVDRIPVIYGSESRLFFIARRWAAQFSENAKVLSYSSSVPEMNHNEIVGWRHPAGALVNVLPILLLDHQDHPRILIRSEVMRELVSTKTEPVLEFWTSGETWLERIWSLILLGDFASFYLAMLNGEDPTPVDSIEVLKNKLKQYAGSLE